MINLQLTAYSTVKAKSVSAKIKNKARMSIHMTFIQQNFRSPSRSREEKEKERKWIQLGKEKGKLSLFVDDILVYIGNPKNAIRKLLELINECGKVAGYKINMQKSLTFLYANNEKSERENKVIIPFAIASKRIKYLRINLLMLAKDIYYENYKTLMKEIKDNTYRLEDIPYSWIGRINIDKMTILCKAAYRFNAIPMKLLTAFFFLQN